MAKQFCGCCGGEMETQTQVWCNRCDKHVLHGLPFWEATWYAQHKKYCPYTTCQFVPSTKNPGKCKHAKAVVDFHDPDSWARVRCEICSYIWQGIPRQWTSRRGIQHQPPKWTREALAQTTVRL